MVGGPLSGNWQITLMRHASTQPQIYSGFLVQSGNSISGSVILGGGCSGVGPVTGSLQGQSLALTINQFGQDLSLTGTVPASSGFVAGQFSTLAGGCTAFPNTGTWTAVQVTPLNGAFHGTLTSSSSGTVDVSGTLNQGSNTGDSTASLSGSIQVTSAPPFCSYLTTATITGLISGTSITLTLFDPNGTQLTQISGSVTPDGTSITGQYGFQRLSNSCLGDAGTMQLSFP